MRSQGFASIAKSGDDPTPALSEIRIKVRPVRKRKLSAPGIRRSVVGRPPHNRAWSASGASQWCRTRAPVTLWTRLVRKVGRPPENRRERALPTHGIAVRGGHRAAPAKKLAKMYVAWRSRVATTVPDGSGIRWQRNVQNVLKHKTDDGLLIWTGRGRYVMTWPYVGASRESVSRAAFVPSSGVWSLGAYL